MCSAPLSGSVAIEMAIKQDWRSVVLCVCLCMAATQTYGYDTGHHTDLIRNALTVANAGSFTSDAVSVITLSNWMADWIGQLPIVAGKFASKLSDFKIHKTRMEALHFDNLFSVDDVARYWYKLIENTRSQVKEIITNDSAAKKAGASKAEMLMFLLGWTLHVIEDFYTHSNWINYVGVPPGDKGLCHNYGEIFIPFDSSNPGPIKSWKTKRFIPGQTESKTVVARKPGTKLNVIQTGYSGAFGELKKKGKITLPATALPHGGYGPEGLNKDSYFKQGFAQGYIDASLASVAWIRMYKDMVNAADTTLWAKVVGYKLSTSLKSYLPEGNQAAFRISEYVTKGGEDVDGHWKGPGSGSLKQTISANKQFLTSNFQTDSAFLKAVYNAGIVPKLVAGLPYEEVSSVTFPTAKPSGAYLKRPTAKDYIVIDIKTNKVKVGSDGHVWSVVVVNGQVFRNTMQKVASGQELELSKKSKDEWRVMVLVPATTTKLDIHYGLFVDSIQLKLKTDDSKDTNLCKALVDAGRLKEHDLGPVAKCEQFKKLMEYKITKKGLNVKPFEVKLDSTEFSGQVGTRNLCQKKDRMIIAVKSGGGEERTKPEELKSTAPLGDTEDDLPLSGIPTLVKQLTSETTDSLQPNNVFL